MTKFSQRVPEVQGKGEGNLYLLCIVVLVTVIAGPSGFLNFTIILDCYGFIDFFSNP